MSVPIALEGGMSAKRENEGLVYEYLSSLAIWVDIHQVIFVTVVLVSISMNTYPDLS